MSHYVNVILAFVYNIDIVLVFSSNIDMIILAFFKNAEVFLAFLHLFLLNSPNIVTFSISNFSRENFLFFFSAKKYVYYMGVF